MSRNNCSVCNPKATSKKAALPLIVQCSSPIIEPPVCAVEPYQIVLAIDTGRFYYWAKKKIDTNGDGIKDHVHFTWVEGKCGEENPISLRQSQLFFRDYDALEVPPAPLPFAILKPTVGTNSEKIQPKTGDYIIDHRENVWYLMNEAGVWVNQGVLFSGLASQQDLQDHIEDTTIHRSINDNGTSNIDLWSASKIQAELNSISMSGVMSHVHDAAEITTGTFDDARISASSVLQHNAVLVHQALDGAGTNTHSQIDAHIADNTKHRQINDSSTASTDLWSAAKTLSELSGKSNVSHTHTVAQITDFATNVDNRINLQKGVSSGIASLDSNGKIPSSQLQLDSVVYKGVWNATANSPVLVSGVGMKGNYYVVSNSGATIIDGISDWKTGDWIIFNGSVWQKSDHTDQVTSVAGKQGAVLLEANDLIDFQTSVSNNLQVLASTAHISNISNPHNTTKSQVGLGNVENIKSNFSAIVAPTVSDDTSLGFTVGSLWFDILAKKTYFCTDSASGAAIWQKIVENHDDLLNTGVNSHTQIDTHIADATIHRKINDAGTATIDLWSASKIAAQLATKASAIHTHDAADTVSGAFANARISESSIVQHNAALIHQNLSGAGSNTHAQIDLHIADDTKHRQINDTGVSTTDLWSASKIAAQLATKSAALHTHDAADTVSGAFENGRISESSVVQHNAALIHQNLTGAGTNTHAQIDLHIDDDAKHREINDAGSAATNLWSASKIIAQLATKSAVVHTHDAADTVSGAFANARISESSVVQHNAALAHQTLSGAGTNTHAQIDTHIADATIHRTINDAGAATTDLWSASKILSQLATKSAAMHTHDAADTVSGAFTNARISESSVVQHNAALLHQNLTGAGTNTHTQIDAHIEDDTKHRQINDTGVSTTDLWSASKISTQLATKATAVHTHDAADTVSGTFTNARISESSVVQHNAALIHQNLTGAGTNTHAQIDLHIADDTKHRQINDAGNAATDLWSASKILSQLAAKASAIHSHDAADIVSGALANSRISESSVVQHNAALLHQNLSGAGTNTHAQIDAHIADDTKHRQINDASSATTDLWSASKISTQLAAKASTIHSHDAADIVSGAFANSRISESSVIQHNAAIIHQNLSGAGTNTHAQIDAHIADATKHRQINDTGTSTTDLWSAAKIISFTATPTPTPAGSNKQVQYNNSGVMAGSENLTIDSDEFPILGSNDDQERPSSPSNGAKLYVQERASRLSVSQVDANNQEYAFQCALFCRQVRTWNAIGGGTSIAQDGFLSTTQGTLTTRTSTSTNYMTQIPRLGFTTLTSAGRSAGTRHGLAQFWRGNNSKLGGFFYVVRFGMSSSVTVATQRTFVGLTATTSAFGDADPSTLINLIGLGNDSADAQFSIIHNDGSGSASKNNLSGGIFNAKTLSTELIEFRLYCKPNSNEINYSVEILGTNNFAQGSVSSNIPASTTFLAPQIWTNNGTTALAASIDVQMQYLETPY